MQHTKMNYAFLLQHFDSAYCEMCNDKRWHIEWESKWSLNKNGQSRSIHDAKCEKHVVYPLRHISVVSSIGYFIFRLIRHNILRAERWEATLA